MRPQVARAPRCAITYHFFADSKLLKWRLFVTEFQEKAFFLHDPLPYPPPLGRETLFLEANGS